MGSGELDTSERPHGVANEVDPFEFQSVEDAFDRLDGRPTNRIRVEFVGSAQSVTGPVESDESILPELTHEGREKGSEGGRAMQEKEGRVIAIPIPRLEYVCPD